MRPGTYETEHGSTVIVKTKHAASCVVYFNDFKEPDACFGCTCVNVDSFKQLLEWQCDVCGGGSAKLTRVSAKTTE